MRVLRARGGRDPLLRHRDGGAAAAAARSRLDQADAEPVTYQVDVPGRNGGGRAGRSGEANLVGPAVLVAHGEVSVPGSGPGKE